jgi:hypothetical protein
MLNTEPLNASDLNNTNALAGRLSRYWGATVDTAGKESAALSIIELDTTPPETAINLRPRRQKDSTFCLNATDDASSTEELPYPYRVNEGQWSTYFGESAATLGGETDLSDSLHRFRLKVKYAAGNEDPSVTDNQRKMWFLR